MVLLGKMTELRSLMFALVFVLWLLIVTSGFTRLEHGDHLSGKPGNVGEFDSCQGMLGILLKVREVSGKKYCQGKVA